MIYPKEEAQREIQGVLDQLSNGLTPTDDEHQVSERLLVDLIRAHGFEASQAYEIVRTVYWRGWNEGWGKGYRAPR